MRRKSEDNEAKTREIENSRGKGGRRQKLRHVDGNVPLKDSSSKKEIEHSSSKKDSRSKAACDSKDLCGSKTKKENKKVQKYKKKGSLLLCFKFI